MGLDMFLYGVRYNSGRLNNDGKTTIVHTQEIYWRKADMIHHWFVEEIQNGDDDCRNYEVTEEELERLLNDCKTVLRYPNISNESLLPTDYEYDDWYYEELKRTVKEIEEVLDKDYDWFSYSSSW